MALPQLAIAAVGAAVPAWVHGFSPDEAEVCLIGPERPSLLEDELNRLVARTRCPWLLPVQADDRLEAAAVRRMLTAAGASRVDVAGVTGMTDQVRRDGGVRRVPALAAGARRELLACGRMPTPVLFATGPLRAAGGWRPGEACWHLRAFRHRPLLARMVDRWPLLATGAYLGTVALPVPPGAGSSRPAGAGLYPALARLLLRQARLHIPGGPMTGRIAALSPELCTLAGAGAEVILIPVAAITAVEPLDP